MQRRWYSIVILMGAAALVAARTTETRAEKPDGIAELRQAFSSAGAPNFTSIVQVQMNPFSLSVTKRIENNSNNGSFSGKIASVTLTKLGNQLLKCTVNGSAEDLFSGLLSMRLEAKATCAAPSSTATSSSTSSVKAVSKVEGHLFPLEKGNELSFVVETEGGSLINGLLPKELAHHMTVVDVLSGITLNATKSPDVIYLIRDEQSYNSISDKPSIVDIYWSSALRWPIQTRYPVGAKNLTLAEHNLIRVAGVGPYVLPDRHTQSKTRGYEQAIESNEEMEVIAETLKFALPFGKNEADRAAIRREIGRLVDETTGPDNHINPNFASIAPFVTTPGSKLSQPAYCTQHGAVVRLICVDEELRTAESEVEGYFNSWASNVQGADRGIRFNNQGDWIRARNEKCGFNAMSSDVPLKTLLLAKPCMLETYNERKKFLESVMGH
jgi:uncharacterized protein YecT (DUF1311 family)